MDPVASRRDPNQVQIWATYHLYMYESSALVNS
jgi:hypothetical protein